MKDLREENRHDCRSSSDKYTFIGIYNLFFFHLPFYQGWPVTEEK